jgi:hypothetical protein
MPWGQDPLLRGFWSPLKVEQMYSGFVSHEFSHGFPDPVPPERYSEMMKGEPLFPA